MIRISKRTDNLPAELSSQRTINSATIIEQKVAAGTLCSKDFDNDIYGPPNVKSRLKEDQHDKCAYCEVTLAGDCGAVEHYRPKTEYKQDDNSPKQLGYYWLAYDWTNMLCSCDKCNNAARKGILFPLRDPATRDIGHKDISREEPLIINPANEDPQKYLCFHEHIAVPVLDNDRPSDKGTCTIKVFDLNGQAANKPRHDLVEARKQIWEGAKALFKECLAAGRSKDEAIDCVVAIHGKDSCQFAGMIRHQKMWP